jgi:hypothetical protein
MEPHRARRPSHSVRLPRRLVESYPYWPPHRPHPHPSHQLSRSAPLNCLAVVALALHHSTKSIPMTLVCQPPSTSIRSMYHILSRCAPPPHRCGKSLAEPYFQLFPQILVTPPPPASICLTLTPFPNQSTRKLPCPKANTLTRSLYHLSTPVSRAPCRPCRRTTSLWRDQTILSTTPFSEPNVTPPHPGAFPPTSSL